jgi:putative glutathione S-transferase
MGRMIDGNWITDEVAISNSKGEFERKEVTFRNWITPDGQAGPSGTDGFKAESGRYHLYIADACPWAHRTKIFRHLKGLENHITMDVVHPDMMDDGWTFSTDFDGSTGDSLFGHAFVRDIYAQAKADFTGRVTVPILWDKTSGTIVNNESSEIIRMFNSAFNEITGNTDDYWPEEMRDEIEEVNTRIYNTLNNGVYRSGFASSQSAYENAVGELFDTLEWLEARLSKSRYLMGDKLTEADLRLIPTLLRFDDVYYHHFKCNLKRLTEFPNLWDYARDLYQTQGIGALYRREATRRHYFYSHRSINPHGILPVGPIADWMVPHTRGT